MGYRKTQIALAILTGAVSATAPVNVGFAQGDVPTDAALAQLDEVTVTARRREELLKDVPLSITAVTSETLEQANMDDLTDLQNFTPGFFVSSQGFAGSDYRGVPNFMIRGLNLPSVMASQPAAILFVDGAPVLSGEQGDLNNVERVEVLRGPQSAYFGRAAFAGAINIVTREPGMDEFGGTLDVEYGNYNAVDVGGSLDVPLLDGTAGLRIYGRTSTNDGQYRNTSFQGGRLGDREKTSLGISGVLKPTDDLKIRVRAERVEYDDGLGQSTKILTNQMTCDPKGLGRNTWICGKVFDFPEDLLGYTTPMDSEFLALASATSLYGGEVFLRHGGMRRKIDLANMTISYSLSDTIELTSVTSVSEENSQSYRDETNRDSRRYASMFPYADTRYGYPGFWYWRNDANEDFSQELRLDFGGDGRLSGTFGANYVDGTSTSISWADSSVSAFGQPGFGGPVREVDVATVGVFAGLYFDVTSRLNIGAEARYQEDTITSKSWRAPVRQGAPNAELEDTWGSFSPRISVSYALTDDITTFANWAKGTRPGTFNANLLTVNPLIAAELQRQTGAVLAVDPEELTNFEVGVKWSALGRRFNGSAVAYRGKLIDQQVSRSIVVQVPELPVSSVSAITNTGSTRIQGVELDGTYIFDFGLTLAATFGLNELEFLDYFCQVCVNIAGYGDVRGNQFPQVPRTKGSLSATYERTFASGLDGFLRADYLYEGTKYAEETNLAETGARNIVNLRTGIDTGDFRVEGYVENLFEDDTPLNVVQVFDTSNFSGNAIGVILPQKRTYGLRVRYSF